MQSEFVRLITQVEKLEKMHRAGLTYSPDVDELFAIGRECRKAIDADEARSQPLFRPRVDAATIAAEAGAAVEQALTQVLTRVLSAAEAA